MWSNEHTGIILCYRQHENVSVGDPKVFANLCYTIYHHTASLEYKFKDRCNILCTLNCN